MQLQTSMLFSLRSLFDRRWLGLVLYLILALGLSLAPLYRGLGFERAFATGVITPFLAAMWAARAPSPSPWRRWVEASLGVCVGVAFSALAGAIVEWASMPCDQKAGLLWMVLLPGVGGVYGAAVGAAVRARSPAVSALAIAMVMAGHLVLVATRLYLQPQVYVYSVWFGYWPGSLYDEALELQTALLAHRALTLAVAGLWVAARAALDAGTTRAWIGAGLLAAVTAGVRWSGPELGFVTTRQDLQVILPVVVETEHFRIHLPADVDDATARAMAREHEFSYAQLLPFFGLEPAGTVDSWVFASRDQKAQALGLRGTQMARPWSREFFIHDVKVPHPSVQHELAHVFAAEWAEGPLRVPTTAVVMVNIGIVEGVAVAAAPRPSPLSLHAGARAMKEFGVLPDLTQALRWDGFWGHASSRAYAAAGSFVRFLLDERGGREALAELYRSNDFRRAYGASLDVLVEQWLGMLDRVELTDLQRRWAEHRYRRAGIFQRVCPHETANLRAEGRSKQARGDVDGARAAYDAAYAFNPDPGYHLDLAKKLFEAARTEPALEILAWLPDRLPTHYHRDLRSQLRANAAWLEGDLEQARAGFQSAPPTTYDEARLHAARLDALTRTGTVSQMLARYLGARMPGGEADRALQDWARAAPSDPLAAYLLARRLQAGGDLKAADRELQRALSHGLASPLAWEAERMRAEIRRDLGDPDAAIDILSRMLAGRLPFEVRSRVETMQARIRFDRDWQNASVSVRRSEP